MGDGCTFQHDPKERRSPRGYYVIPHIERASWHGTAEHSRRLAISLAGVTSELFAAK
jgi:hypothetical protein